MIRASAIWIRSFPSSFAVLSDDGIRMGDRKRFTNIAKHGIDFVAAARVFDGRILGVENRRRDYDMTSRDFWL